MPQMSPMNWLLLATLFISLLVLTISLMNFSYKSLNTLKEESILYKAGKFKLII